MNIGEELGELLTQRAVSALGIEAGKAESYGKAAAVGENGELEHAAAVLHPPGDGNVHALYPVGAAEVAGGAVDRQRVFPNDHAAHLGPERAARDAWAVPCR